MSKRRESTDTGPITLIQERQARLEEILDVANRETNDGALSLGVKYELVACIEDFHRVLSRYSGQDIVSPGKIPDISPIKERKGQQTEVITQSDGWDSEPSYEVRPAIDEVPYSYLQDIAGQLEAAAGKPTGGRQLPNPSKLSDDGPAGGVDDPEQRAAAADFEQSNFFRSLYKDVEGDRGGGAIIIVDAEDARTGVGKTGAACGMAEFVSWYFGYELRDRDGVLSGREYLDLFKQHPNEEQVSVCVWDEAVGGGSGDARRAMAQENVDLGRAWQIMRDRRVITFVTLPDWGDLDSRLQKLADYRVWCRRDIGSMQAYEIGTTFEGGDIRTRGLGPGEGAEPIAFPDVTDDSDLYQAIKAQKDKLQETDSLDAGDLVEDETDTDSEDAGPDLHKIADEVADNVDAYTSVHGGNGTTYLDSDMIELEHDLSIRKAEKVKKLVERKGVEI